MPLVTVLYLVPDPAMCLCCSNKGGNMKESTASARIAAETAKHRCINSFSFLEACFLNKNGVKFLTKFLLSFLKAALTTVIIYIQKHPL